MDKVLSKPIPVSILGLGNVTILELLEKGVVDIDDEIEEEQEDVNEYTKEPVKTQYGYHIILKRRNLLVKTPIDCQILLLIFL